MITVFAFGSNMHAPQLFARCPGARLIGPGILRDHRIAFGGWSTKWRGAVATIEQKAGHRTPGLLYELTDEDIERLDGFEGVPTVYERITVLVHRGGPGRPRRAHTYRLLTRMRGRPSAEYLDRIWSAYREWGFDASGLADALAEISDTEPLASAVRGFRATAAWKPHRRNTTC